MKNKGYILIIFLCTMIACGGKKEKDNQTEYDSYLLVGTYTSGTSKGINIFQINTETGDYKFIAEKEVFNPSYLAISDNKKYVYAVSEGDSLTSKVTAYQFDKKKGSLEVINEQESGSGPCFVTIDKENKMLITADYGGGSMSYFEITESGGITSPIIKEFKGNSAHPTRQTESHVHHIAFSPDERFVFVNDLGTDKIYRFEVNPAETPDFIQQTTPAHFEVKPGSGPRHTAFHPSRKYAYLITEISGDVIAFDYDAEKGILNEIQTIKADSIDAQGSADIHITPNGKYLYASNRLKGDGLAIFSIDQNSGKLTKIGYQETGIHPRNFVITENGKLLLVANRDSNNIQIFTIGEDGLLSKLDKDIELSMPVCLKLASID